MVHRSAGGKISREKAKRGRKSGGDGETEFGVHRNGYIPPELDEDIDDDLAFDSDDEAKFGAFFGSSSGKKKKNKIKNKKGDDDDEVKGTFDRLNAVGIRNQEEEMGFSDDSRDEIDLSEMLDSKDEMRESRARRRQKKQDAKVGRRSSVKDPVTMEAETLLGSTEAVPVASRVGMRKLLSAAADAPATKRLEKALNNNKLLLTVDADDTTKDRRDRAKVREVVTGQLSKYKSVLKEQQTTRHLAFPLRQQEAVCPVPKTLSSLVSAVQENKDGIQSDAVKQRAAASTSMADRMSSLLQASGLLKDSAPPTSTGNENEKSGENFVAFDSRNGEEEGKPLSIGYMQKLKSMLSYENAKRRRFNKIKSKTYRRILRKEKEREQERKAKAFELLNPEEARRRLQKKMDDMRAEERVTQKHKNTSKWVRHAKKFAKTDSEAKDAIDEQHQIHARLMQKMEDELADEINGPVAVEDPSSEEEEQAVDQLLAADRTKPAKSILWREDSDNNKKENLSDMTPVDRARAELRGMAFMQKATQRKNQQLDDEIQALEADVREYQETGELARAADILDEENRKSRRRARRSEGDGGDDADALMEDDEDARELHLSDPSTGKQSQEKKARRGGSKKVDPAASSSAGGRRQFRSDSSKKSLNVELGTKPGLSLSNRDSNDHESEEEQGLVGEEPEDIISGYDQEEGEETNPVKKKTRTEPAQAAVPQLDQVGGFAGDRKPAQVKPNQKKNLSTSSTRVTILPNKNPVAAPSAVVQVGAGSAAVDSSVDQDYLVARAFANDEVDEEFLALKSRQVDDIMKPVDKNASLPGWGEWGGESTNLNVAHQARVAKMELARRIEKSSLMKARADAGLENVIINHEVDLVPGKYQLHMVPRPFSNAQEFSRSMRQPLGPEWNTALSFKEGNQPRITTIQGVAIDPLSLDAHVKKTKKTQRRKVVKKTKIATKAVAA